MNDEDIKKMLEDTYNDSKEDTVRSMVKDFYSRRMLGTVILVWAYAVIFVALAIYSGIKFFKTDQAQFQIMYAAIFVCCIQFVVLMKIFAWQMIHKNSIKREIKRLELRIAELNETVKNK